MCPYGFSMHFPGPLILASGGPSTLAIDTIRPSPQPGCPPSLSQPEGAARVIEAPGVFDLRASSQAPLRLRIVSVAPRAGTWGSGLHRSRLGLFRSCGPSVAWLRCANCSRVNAIMRSQRAPSRRDASSFRRKRRAALRCVADDGQTRPHYR